MTKNPAFQVFNGLAPAQWPKAMPINLDFSTVSEIVIDLVQEEQNNIISFVQTVLIDNNDNDNELVIIFEQTGQRIVCPPNQIIVWPVVAPEKPRFSISTTPAVNLNVHLLLLNVPMPYSTLGANVINAVLEQITGSFVDKSLTLNGASQTLMAANPLRKRFTIQNLSSNAGSVWVNYGAAAVADNTSLELQPGDTLDSNFGPLTLQSITIIGTNTEKVYAKEM